MKLRQQYRKHLFKVSSNGYLDIKTINRIAYIAISYAIEIKLEYWNLSHNGGRRMTLNIGAEIKDNGKKGQFEVGQEKFYEGRKETPEQARERLERERAERNRR